MTVAVNLSLPTSSAVWSRSRLAICNFSYKPTVVLQKSRPNFSCAVMTSGHSGDRQRRIDLRLVFDKARRYWESCPEPVKKFPWNRALENFIQLIFDLCLAVMKWLCIPLLAITSLSELSYCAHERKLFLAPIPLLAGTLVAGALRETALELSPLLKEAEVPWHLISIAIFFLLLKLPGPYYPYWGRILIPHFANGGLWRILWWCRSPKKSADLQQTSITGSDSGSNKL